jgi:allantoinase
MALAPERFDYAPIIDRPVIRWPNNARVAFWVAPNMEFFEYLPESRPTQPDIPFYARMDYGNRVGFWRMLDVLNKHKVRACCCLNLELLDHLPEVKDAMIAADWDYMAHGLYNSRPIYDYTEEQERAYWQDFITHLKEMTGKRLKGRLGGGAGYTVRTDDLMAEAGCLYHTSWIVDDQPWPINVRGGQKFIYVPYTGQTNDAGMLAWNREADYFQQMIKDQFDTLYREGAENGRVMCLSLPEGKAMPGDLLSRPLIEIAADLRAKRSRPRLPDTSASASGCAPTQYRPAQCGQASRRGAALYPRA